VDLEGGMVMSSRVRGKRGGVRKEKKERQGKSEMRV
jgi:hypothetical protein